MSKIPTAWLQLTYQKVKLLAAIGGMTFIVSLIFIQLGFRTALFESSVRIPQSMQGDIVLVSPRSKTLVSLANFSQRRLYQALAFEEVDYIVPIYTGSAKWRNPQDKNIWRNIYVIGFDVSYPVFDLPEVQKNLEKLKIPDVVLFDRGSRAEFGPVVEQFKSRGIVKTEIRGKGPNDRQVIVGGIFKVGTSFGIDGTLITSDLNFLRIFSNRKKGFINLGLVKLKPGQDVNKFLSKIRAYFPDDIKVLSRQEFINSEKEYWLNNTAVGFIFNIALLGAIIVGIVIVYQILYSNIADALPEYATLKAIGYKHTYLLSVVFQQATILAILGYIPGFFIAVGIYKLSRSSTGIPVFMDINRSLMVFMLTILMAAFSGMITLQKLRQADPADIF